jgi:Lsr2/ERCC4 domain
VATVERKSLQDLVATLTSGKLGYLLADLAAVGRAAVVVEARYSEVFQLTWVRPSVVAGAIAECQVRFPTVPIMFCENRSLAQEWTFRFLGAALAEASEDAPGGDVLARLPVGRPISSSESARAAGVGQPTTAHVRAWARQHGYDVPERGRLRPEIWQAYLSAQ